MKSVDVEFDNWCCVVPVTEQERKIQYAAFVGGWKARQPVIDSLIREASMLNPMAKEVYENLGK